MYIVVYSRCNTDNEDSFYAALDSQGSGRLRPSRGNPHDRSTFYSNPYVGNDNVPVYKKRQWNPLGYGK